MLGGDSECQARAGPGPGSGEAYQCWMAAAWRYAVRVSKSLGMAGQDDSDEAATRKFPGSEGWRGGCLRPEI